MGGRASSRSELHTKGYQVIRGLVKISERVLNKVKKATVDKKIGYIFNHNENKRNDMKRRQRNLSLDTKIMQAFDQQIRTIVKNHVNTKLTPADPVIIHSKPGCQAQAAHTDFIPTDALKKVSDQYMPLAVLIALIPETRLLVWPNSARLALKAEEELKRVKPIRCEEEKLAPGDMIVFRGDFVHAGSAYENDNYRIHYYLDSPEVPREPNRTWLIGSSNDAMRRIIRPSPC